MQKVLVLGAKGMLGQELVCVFEKDARYEVIAWDRDDIDVANDDVLQKKISDLCPHIIFNAVAYNAVDACETDDKEYAKAQKLNGDVPGELAKIAQEIDAILVHYSTDYVFDGIQIEYDEDAIARPLSRYGQTKLQGEKNVAKNAQKYYIIRLSKLFGKPASSTMGKRSFFDVMRELSETKKEIQAVDGEMSKFTYAPDLAQASKGIIETHMPYGIYHVANDGAATWYDGVKELYAILGIITKVAPVPPETFPRPAKRPASSVLKVTKIKNLRHYRDALREYYGK